MPDNAECMRPPAGGRLSGRRRALEWLAWWVLMMALWVMIDDSVQFDELLAGAGAAALAALAAVLATSRASARSRIRDRRLAAGAAEMLRLPAQVARDTLTVFAALGRALATGRPPDGEYAEVPAGGPPGQADRVLLTGIRSIAPNTFVVTIDDERDVMVVHHLVTRRKLSEH